MACVVLGCDVEVEAACGCGTVYSVDAEAVGVRMGPWRVLRMHLTWQRVCRVCSDWKGVGAARWGRARGERGSTSAGAMRKGYGGYCGCGGLYDASASSRQASWRYVVYAASHGDWEAARGCSGRRQTAHRSGAAQTAVGALASRVYWRARVGRRAERQLQGLGSSRLAWGAGVRVQTERTAGCMSRCTTNGEKERGREAGRAKNWGGSECSNGYTPWFYPK
jgi:hypothetical protein